MIRLSSFSLSCHRRKTRNRATWLPWHGRARERTKAPDGGKIMLFRGDTWREFVRNPLSPTSWRGENEKDAVAVPGEYDEYFHNVACSLGIVVAGVNLGQMLVINVPPSFKRNWKGQFSLAMPCMVIFGCRHGQRRALNHVRTFRQFKNRNIESYALDTKLHIQSSLWPSIKRAINEEFAGARAEA